MGIFRINMSDPTWRSSACRSSFDGVLTLPERLSFHGERVRSVWIGYDATLINCAAVDHTNQVLNGFQVSEYSDYFPDLAGLIRADYELVAISEFLSLMRFLVVREPDLHAIIVGYVGDSQNVATWAKCSRPGNGVAHHFARILSRLENAHGFTLLPMYISSSNNKLHGESPRLINPDAIIYGDERGIPYIDVGHIAKSYFDCRFVIPPLGIPTDKPERVRTIMQYVAKRIVRFIPSQIMGRARIYSLWGW